MAFKIESSLLDACALAILHRGDTYGYEITQEMKKSITVSESTLYPVLRRLQQEELCRTYDQPYQGRNRRYYTITEKGEAQLRDYLKQWNDYRNAVQRLLDGPEPERPEEKSPAVENGNEKAAGKEAGVKKSEGKTGEKPDNKTGKESAGKTEDKPGEETEGKTDNKPGEETEGKTDNKSEEVLKRKTEKKSDEKTNKKSGEKSTKEPERKSEEKPVEKPVEKSEGTKKDKKERGAADE